MSNNEVLRTALLAQGLTTEKLADRVGVAAKTVQRWITQGKVPYRRTQYAVAAELKVSVGTLWPDGQSAVQYASSGAAEIVAVYPHRQVVPADLWSELYERATQHVDVLVYAGLYLSEDVSFKALMAAKAETASVRLMLGDPDCPAVRQRGVDEGHGIMGGKIRNALANFRRLVTDSPGVKLRLHDTTLYNSIYRADDEMLVNTHVFGLGAYQAPVFHLRKVPGGNLFGTYAESVDQVWQRARPVSEDDFKGAA